MSFMPHLVVFISYENDFLMRLFLHFYKILKPSAYKNQNLALGKML